MLKVKDTEKHHTSICDIAFRDPKTSSRLGGAPKTKNIVTFVKVCTHYEWFYNEDGKIGIICCKACWKNPIEEKGFQHYLQRILFCSYYTETGNSENLF